MEELPAGAGAGPWPAGRATAPPRVPPPDGGRRPLTFPRSFIHRSMVDDQQLGLICNVLGAAVFGLVVIYHYISSSPSYA